MARQLASNLPSLSRRRVVGGARGARRRRPVPSPPVARVLGIDSGRTARARDRCARRSATIAVAGARQLRAPHRCGRRLLVGRPAAAAPDVRVLVTSQETLKAADEHVYRLGALAVPPARARSRRRRAPRPARWNSSSRARTPPIRASADAGQSCRGRRDLPAPRRHSARDRAGCRARAAARRRGRARAAERSLQRADRRRARRAAPASDAARDARMEPRACSRPTSRPCSAAWASSPAASRWRRRSTSRATTASTPWTRSITSARSSTNRSCLPKATRPALPHARNDACSIALERLANAGEMPRRLHRHAKAMLALLEPFDQRRVAWRATGTSGARGEGRARQSARRARVGRTRKAKGLPPSRWPGLSYSVWWSSFQLAEGLARCASTAPPRRRRPCRPHRGALLAHDSEARSVLDTPRELRGRGAARRCCTARWATTAILRGDNLRRGAGRTLRAPIPERKRRSMRRRVWSSRVAGTHASEAAIRALFLVRPPGPLRGGAGVRAAAGRAVP